nr:MAG TPA: hypothetical protein [Caudoviricetes sp.]
MPVEQNPPLPITGIGFCSKLYRVFSSAVFAHLQGTILQMT